MWYIGSGKTQERLGDEKQLVTGRKRFHWVRFIMLQVY